MPIRSLILWLVSSPVFAEARALPEVRVEAQVVTELEDQAPRLIQGSLYIKNWQAEGGRCLYLPYQDGDYGEDRGTNRRFEVFAGTANKLAFEGGYLRMDAVAPVASLPHPTLAMAELKTPPNFGPDDEIVIRFEARVPRLPSSNPDDWFYDGFLPQLMPKCLPDGLDPAYYRPSLAAKVTGRIRIPTGWEYQGPGQLQADGTVSIGVTARTYAFALGRKFQHRKFQVGTTAVDVAFLTPGFDDIAETVQATLPTLEAMFGPYPHPTLAIVETSELQRHGLPGIIAINKPAQQIFGHAQKNWLNWRHWITTVQLARQWYGGAVVAESPDDEWLVTGTTEFATVEALSRDPKHYDLFASRDDGKPPFLSFDYLQVSEISAATLRRFSPFAALTDEHFVSRHTWNDQHALLFTKHAFALRQLKSFAGDSAFFAFLKNFTTHSLNDMVRPKDFQAYFGRMPSPFSPQARRDLGTYLSRWWQEEGWPDFQLEDMKTEPVAQGKHLTQVTATQGGAVDFPPLIGLEDEAGGRHVARAQPAKDRPEVWQADFVTAHPPAEALVDPEHEAFDSNRFNNSSAWPDVDFFPGGARTLRDDAYTILWFPYAFRRPGEPFSVGVQSALFRYIQGGAFARFESAPSEKKNAVEVRQAFQAPSLALTTDLTFSQNYDNDRLAELSVQRSPLFGGDPVFGMAVKTRHRERVGQPETQHETVALQLSMKPLGRSRSCSYNLGFEIEKAPEEWADDFAYERKFGVASGGCYLTPRTSLGVRVFAGSLYAEGEVPEQALFKPTNLREARLILDQRGLTRSKKLTAIGTDLLLPFYLPLPRDSLILTRQMRWRLFYDYGHSYDLDVDYRSAGFGPVLPFGGDLAGAGSLALTKLSLLVIAYSHVDGEEPAKASVVFDFTGEL
jgi:hypothetical protein